MDVDDDLPEAVSIPGEPVINTSNIKKDILYRAPENIINSNSLTSTPEKNSPAASISEAPADGATNRQPLKILIDQGERLHASKSPEVPVQSLAKVNCPEKIVICVDISSEMKEKRYKAKAGTSFSGLDIVKRALKLFVNNKQLISGSNKKHSFALVLLLDQTLWMTDFTKNVSHLFTQIDSLEALNEQRGTFNMSTLFDLIIEKAMPPIVDVAEKGSPPFIVRVILTYGRSQCVPVFETHESQNLLTGSPCFFMDIVYLHEAPTDDNQSEEIYQELCDLDTRGFSHVFEICKTPTKVFDAFGMLLAHPLQRATQSQSGFSLEPSPMHLLPQGDDIIGLP